MGIPAFVEEMVMEHMEDAKLFLAGGAFDLLVHGLETEDEALETKGKELLAEAERYFPGTGMGKIHDYFRELKRSSDPSRLLLIRTYSEQINSDYHI
jgi:hypothetical protein